MEPQETSANHFLNTERLDVVSAAESAVTAAKSFIDSFSPGGEKE